MGGVITMNGMTCLSCSKGFYPGYEGPKTAPCTECGHQAPARMSQDEFREAVAQRNSNFAAGTQPEPFATLIQDAADASDVYGDDELERYARTSRL